MAPAVAEMGSSKPGRSEELLDAQEQAMIEQAVRQKFEEAAPKRASKPVRSESQDLAEQQLQGFIAEVIPEHIKFQDLEASSEHVVTDTRATVTEEFVETEYYKGLMSVDKSLHHTTGTGFIHVEISDGVTFDFKPNGLVRTRSQSNPATNDWIPSSETVLSHSDKPSRSEPSV